MIGNGSCSIILVVEAVYSMDGHICPIQELLKIAREEMSASSLALLPDEAHATDTGPKGWR